MPLIALKTELQSAVSMVRRFFCFSTVRPLPFAASWGSSKRKRIAPEPNKEMCLTVAALGRKARKTKQIHSVLLDFLRILCYNIY